MPTSHQDKNHHPSVDMFFFLRISFFEKKTTIYQLRRLFVKLQNFTNFIDVLGSKGPKLGCIYFFLKKNLC